MLYQNTNKSTILLRKRSLKVMKESRNQKDAFYEWLWFDNEISNKVWTMKNLITSHHIGLVLFLFCRLIFPAQWLELQPFQLQHLSQNSFELLDRQRSSIPTVLTELFISKVSQLNQIRFALPLFRYTTMHQTWDAAHLCDILQLHLETGDREEKID